MAKYQHSNSEIGYIDLSRVGGYDFNDGELGEDVSFGRHISSELFALSQQCLDEVNINRIVKPYFERINSLAPPVVQHVDHPNSGRVCKPYTAEEDDIILNGKCPRGRRRLPVENRRKLLMKKQRKI